MKFRSVPHQIVKYCKRILSSVEYSALLLCALGVLVMMSGLFLTRWRVDEHGTKPLQRFWSVTDLDAKYYGLLQVRGKRSQAWSTVTRITCDLMGAQGTQVVSYGHHIGSTIVSAIRGNGLASECQGSESCGQGYTDHMHARCKQYEAIDTVNTATLMTSFLTILACFCSLLAAVLGGLKKTGGIAFGMLFFSGTLSVCMSLAWALITSRAFTELGKTAWYPYPDLGIGWFLHLYGGILILFSSIIFGWLVLPRVWNYDSEQAKIDRRQRQLVRMKERQMAQEQQLGLKQQEKLRDSQAYQGAAGFDRQADFGAPAMQYQDLTQQQQQGAYAMVAPPISYGRQTVSAPLQQSAPRVEQQRASLQLSPPGEKAYTGAPYF